MPPGTEFPFIVRIMKPSRRDIALFLLGNRVADGLGYGNYSKLRGDATTRWLLLANGFAHVSVHNLLEQADTKTVEQQINVLAAKPADMGIADGQVVFNKDLVSAVDELAASVKA